MIKAASIAFLVALMTATSAQAGGRSHGYGHFGHGYGHHGRHWSGYGHGYGHHGRHWSGYGHHYGRHRHHGHYGYLAAGLLLGGAFVHSFNNRPYVVRERVVYRRPIERVVYRSPTEQAPVAVEREHEPVPAEPPPYYYRRDVDGACWLIERADDGSETITPQDPNVCG